MATIKAIEGRTVHQIQSGQVIVDLNSGVKELVENSLDAGATSIDVRFKNHGLESIEVQDNGSGISPDNFEAVALKHYTSKITNYGDLDTLETFGFRGEALSSLAALSILSVTTAREQDAPKGSKLLFETSGKLRETKLVPAQRGTIVSVDNIFQNLPVRRRELERNIKREYNKVLGLLYAYACIAVNVKFTVSSILKGKKTTVFATKLNGTVRENIANVFGAKTLSALVPLDLHLEMEASNESRLRGTRGQQENSRQVRITGHISRPVVGEGRLLPDRQMFFVNGRPCGLPQIAKAFNEAYRSFNLTQSPFIFADLRLDTGAYDVNVAPDKRTILLHDQQALLESIKTNLAEMFDQQEQTVPQNVFGRTPAFKQTTMLPLDVPAAEPSSPLPSHLKTQPSGADDDEIIGNDTTKAASRKAFLETIKKLKQNQEPEPEDALEEEKTALVDDTMEDTLPSHHIPSNKAKLRQLSPSLTEIPSFTQHRVPKNDDIVMNAFDRARPRRSSPEMATITIGDETVVSPLRTPRKRQRQTEDVGDDTPSVSLTKLTSLRATRAAPRPAATNLARRLRDFAAPGSLLSQAPEVDLYGDDEEASVSEEASEVEDEDDVSEQEEDSHEVESIQTGSPPLEAPQAAEETLLISSDSGEALDQEHGGYIDDAGKKAAEDRKVAQLIANAEKELEPVTDLDLAKHAKQLMHGPRHEGAENISLICQTVSLEIDSLRSIFVSHNRCLEAVASTSEDKMAEDELDDMTDDISRLELTIAKPDFPLMRIIGQFNLGFIITSRTHTDAQSNGGRGGRHVPRENLFIIDQHASAEKTTFERLAASLVLESQPLVAPLQLSLTAVEEEILLSSLPALRSNGFSVAIDPEAPVGARCSLLTLPISKGHTFGLTDLEELLSILQDSPQSVFTSNSATGAVSIPRPSKVRALLASRACRSSVMIGTALNKRQMGKIVAGLGGLEKPWNCPHGRPTMRHLVSLDYLDGWGGEIDGY